MNSKATLLSPLVLLGLVGASSLFAAPGLGVGPPVGVRAVVPNIECDRTHCFESTQVFTNPNRPEASAPLAPVVVGPPAGQRYQFKPPSASCELVDLSANVANPQVYFVTEPIPVPLGSTHVTLSSTMESNLAGTGFEAIATMFGRLEIRRAPSASLPGGGSWVIADYGYVLTRTGSTSYTSRYGKATYVGLEDLALLPPIGQVPSMIEVRTRVNSYTSGGYVFSYGPTEPPSPGICKGKLQVTF